tara:strand:- start:4927 stop:5082 length:156 start_codon:yes stop_codon:yes gene_type:complete
MQGTAAFTTRQLGIGALCRFQSLFCFNRNEAVDPRLNLFRAQQARPHEIHR